MAATDPRDLARRLTLVLPAAEREAFQRVQVRLARLLARLSEIYAELVETHGSLAAAAQDERPVQPAEFRPGATLRLGESFVRTDPRPVLAERMNIGAWADLIGELAAAVLHAPDLARHEVLTVLTDLDHGLLRELIDHLAPEEADTDEFPVQPDRETG
jgi:hypothetical protein